MAVRTRQSACRFQPSEATKLSQGFMPVRSSTGWRRLPSHGEGSQDDRPLDGHRPGLAGNSRPRYDHAGGKRGGSASRESAGPGVVQSRRSKTGSSARQGRRGRTHAAPSLRSPRPVNRQGKAETLRAAAERRSGQGGSGRSARTLPSSSTTARKRRKREERVAGEARGTRLSVPRRNPRRGAPVRGTRDPMATGGDSTHPPNVGPAGGAAGDRRGQRSVHATGTAVPEGRKSSRGKPRHRDPSLVGIVKS